MEKLLRTNQDVVEATEGMLYLFAGFPGQHTPLGVSEHLSARGIYKLIDEVEKLGIILNNDYTQFQKEGVYTPGPKGEFLYPVKYRVSDRLIADGITWDWWPTDFSFGCGVKIFKTSASRDFKTVIHGTSFSEDEYLEMYGPTRMDNLVKERRHIRHEGWIAYENRFLAGKCPLRNHEVFITGVVTVDPLPEFAYKRLRDIIERDAKPKYLNRYKSDRYFSPIRRYDGKPAHGGISTNEVEVING